MDQEVKLMNKILNKSQKINVLAKLSQGSYGQIFLVQQTKTKIKYVMKALQIKKLQKQEKIHQSFIQSLILRKLNHPGIIKIYQTIQTEQYFNQILDYCPYGDVFKLITKVNNHMNLIKKKKQIMIFYLAQILEALSYLHTNKIIHRDFKPQNIVVANNFHIKIIDFGTAKINNDQYLSEIQQQSINDLKFSKNNKQLVGSAHYISPEALKFQYSQKSDIWAFGIIIYKFYLNTLPFTGSNNFQIFKSIKQSQPQIHQDIHPNIRQVIQNCLKKNPQERPSAQQLKKYNFFQNVNFATIFQTIAPISQQQLSTNSAINMSPTNSPTKKNTKTNEQLFSVTLEKRMFFGNYKPRILSLYTKNNILYFAYKYVDTKIIKNYLQLNMNDYCQKISNNEFQIKCDDKKYVFKISKKDSIDKTVEEINTFIRQHFKLN